MELAGLVVVITGAASGIGRAAALCCAERGAQVVLADVNQHAGSETSALITKAGHEARFVQTDVREEAQVQALLATAEQTYGRIDALITAAGILREAFVPVEESDLETFQQVQDVNVRGTFLCVKHAVPALKRAGGGVVLMLSSAAGVSGGSSSAVYGTSKGGVHGMFLMLESHLAPANIRVHAICPGGIATPMKIGVLEAQAQRAGHAVDEQELAMLGDPIGIGTILAWLVSADAAYMRGTIFTR